MMERSPRSRKTTGTSKSTTNKSHKTGMSGKSSKPLLEKYFLEELKDIYWAEKHLTKALPKMQKAATSDELANAFADHLSVTEDQVGRLEDVFEMLGETPRAKKCEAMEGLVNEAQTIIEETEDGSATRDVALIMAAQKVEHYEIATYGGLTQLAKTLGRDDIAGLLGQTLQEEKETDELLTSIAENNSNITASEEGHEGEQNEEED
jgi:ferritin-like metal-binding protein YciE